MEPATQNFLEIQDVREGIVILKDNNLRGILVVSSSNFALKSDEEQMAISYAYQSFLNSLDFPCQIIIQSRNLNITPYLDSIKQLEDNQSNELLRVQTFSYREFIKELVKGDNVMTKSFYVIVPYSLAEALGVSGTVRQINPLNLFKGSKGRELNTADFEKAKNQLWQRMEFLASGLRRCELEVAPLTSAEVIELFWATHHPAEAEVGYYPEILPELLK